MGQQISWTSGAGLGVESPRQSAGRKTYPPLERCDGLSAERFFKDYVAQGRAVLVPGALRGCRALERWNYHYLRAVSGERPVQLKQGLSDAGVAGLRSVPSRLGDYLDELEDYEARLSRGAASDRDRPAYLHDVPLLSVLPDAQDDLQGFPAGYFPAWYRGCCLEFAQFFLGPKHSLTPLHFDCLLTHNLFFQVSGRKRFILLDHDQLRYCYPYRWRWCEVDAEHPDYARHPLYSQAAIQECVVEPGDVLYMPPGMLHHVRSLEASMSFNVDWHTPASALRGVLALGRGLPMKNAYYNAVAGLGLCTGISAERLLPWYRSYLNYVS